MACLTFPHSLLITTWRWKINTILLLHWQQPYKLMGAQIEHKHQSSSLTPSLPSWGMRSRIQETPIIQASSSRLKHIYFWMHKLGMSVNPTVFLSMMGEKTTSGAYPADCEWPTLIYTSRMAVSLHLLFVISYSTSLWTDTCNLRCFTLIKSPRNQSAWPGLMQKTSYEQKPSGKWARGKKHLFSAH